MKHHFTWEACRRYVRLPAAEKRWHLLLSLCFLSTFLLLNQLAHSVLRRSEPNSGYALIAHKWELVETSGQPVDWLILGDSSGNQGLSPEVLDEELGTSSLNLCTYGDLLLVDDLWLLQRYIANHGAPGHVLLVHVYDVWERPAPDRRSLQQIRLPWNAWTQLEPVVPLDARWRAELAYQQYLPLLTRRQALRQLAVEPARWRKPRRQRFTDQGFMPVRRADPDAVVRNMHYHLDKLRDVRFECSQVNRRALDRILDLAEQHRFQVFAVNSPLYDKLNAHPTFQNYYAELSDWLQAIAAQRDSLQLVAHGPFTLPANLMQSVDHVTEDGARAYTRFVARHLRDRATFAFRPGNAR